MKKILKHIKDRLHNRKRWILAGIFFLLEMSLFVYPVGWLREDVTNYLTGSDSWLLEADAENAFFCQEFMPEYSNLESLSLVIGTVDERALEGGSMTVRVTDAENNILFAKEISYAGVNRDSYTDVKTNLVLDAGEKYYLAVHLGADDSGTLPAVRVCSLDQYMPENTVLMQGDPIDGTQLVTRYAYTNAITRDKILKAVFLCMLTALVIGIGLPENRIVRKIAGFGILLVIPYILGRRLELLTINTNCLLPFALNWNMAIMYLLEVVLLLCSRSLRFSAVFTSAFLTVIYSVNYFVYAFRGVPVKLNELTAAGTAARVAGGYALTPNVHLAMAWCVAILFIVFGLSVGTPKREKKSVPIIYNALSFAAGIIILAVSGYQLLYTDFLEKKGFANFRGFDQNMIYQFNGFLVSTCLDIQNSRIEEPEGYSREAVKEILQNADGTAEEAAVELPHVILIMNESFSDLRVLGNLQLSQENLSFFNSLTENTVRGYGNASVLGGGTANSEFEVFTGCSMGLLPASYYAYQQCMIKPMNSMITTMEENGYTTYSIHPESKKNWNRDRIYQYLNFDNSLWIEDFEGAETLHSGVTDGENYRKVEELFENRKDGEKLFVFDLTIQNHGGYPAWQGEDSVEALNAPSEEAETYLSLIKASDEDFKELISYFEKQDEKVIICMYGDHQPKFSDESFYESIYQQTEGLTHAEQVMNQYKVPFVIWANYDIPEQGGLDISLNYLGALLMDVAGLNMSSYFAFLHEQMEEYPIITVNGYVDAEGNIFEWSGENNEFSEYRMLQYNYLFDKNTVTEGF